MNAILFHELNLRKWWWGDFERLPWMVVLSMSPRMNLIPRAKVLLAVESSKASGPDEDGEPYQG